MEAIMPNCCNKFW